MAGRNDDIPAVHRLDKMMQGVPEEWESKIKKQLGAPIIPLPACTVFCGQVHFRNLTCAELGALLISLKPDLAFDGESSEKTSPNYGLKIGKGKPRGLGSVTSDLKVELDRLPEDAYSCLEAPVTEEAADLPKLLSYVKSLQRRDHAEGGALGKPGSRRGAQVALATCRVHRRPGYIRHSSQCTDGFRSRATRMTRNVLRGLRGARRLATGIPLG